MGAFGYQVHFTQSPTNNFQSLKVILMTFSGIRFAKARLLLDIQKTESLSAVFITTLQRYVGTEIVKTFPSALYLNIEFKKF